MAYFKDQFEELARKMMETLDLEQATRKVLGRRTSFEQRLRLIDWISAHGGDSAPYLEKIAEKSKDKRVREHALAKLSAAKGGK